MPDKHTPKISLFSWLPEPRPQGGPLKCWKDVICKDLKEMHIPVDACYAKATTSMAEWCDTYRKARADTTHREQHKKQTIRCNAQNIYGHFAEKLTRRGTSV